LRITNSSQSDTPPQSSHFLVKQTDWCYILGSPKSSFSTQFILEFLNQF